MKKAVLFVVLLIVVGLGVNSDGFAKKRYSYSEVQVLAEKKCKEVMQGLDLCSVFGKEGDCFKFAQGMYKVFMDVYEDSEIAEQFSEMCYVVCRYPEGYYRHRSELRDACIKGFIEGFLGK